MTPTKLRYPLARAISAGALASLALLAACEAKLPTSQEMDEMTASTATATAGRMALVDTAKIAYFINDAPATKADAERVEAARIASVNVLQKGTQRGGEVRIVTRDAAPQGDSTGNTRVDYVRTDPNATAQIRFVTPGDSVRVSATDTQRAKITLRGADGTVMTLRDGGFRQPAPGWVPEPGQTSPRVSLATFTGLMVVDGVITDPATVNSLTPEQIVSVQIVKGASATQQYSDPRAANGVIVITTRKAKP